MTTPDVEFVRLSLDLVSAARRNVGFFRTVAENERVHQESVIVEAIRRYDEVWMPLISDQMVGLTPPVILPPLDIEWVWFCHSLNSVSYREYCESRFSKLIGKPAIFGEENKEYALMRCREIWIRKYPSEPFENEADSDVQNPGVTNEELLVEITKHKSMYTNFSEPYMSEIVYLIAARQRYKEFLYMLRKVSNGCSLLVPTADIMLMWLTHKSYPKSYAEDLREMEDELGTVASVCGSAKVKEVEESKKQWEETFDQIYEKAGGGLAMNLDATVSVRRPIYWEVSDIDINAKYKSIIPRFLLEVYVSVRLNSKMKEIQEDTTRNFLRLRVVRGHRELRIDKPVSSFSKSWKTSCRLYCEFGTRGVVVELRHSGGHCFKRSSLRDTITFPWNDLLRAPSLTLQREIGQQVRIAASITPPVQASYLLKCVPDRVTDDSGAMISDVILKMNRYRPQEGRWLSRTVLDHAGRECFVVRIRVGGGFWRRGGETPSIVKWDDRITEIREGSWSYVAGSIGQAPEKVVGTATPKEPSEQWKVAWSFSSGYELMIRWDSSASISSLNFHLQTPTSADSSAKLLQGRRMQYQVTNNTAEENNDDEGFVTLIRVTEENPNGRATALLNWKLLVIELLPEEDAVFVLLLCISILRSVCEMRKEDIGRLLIRRRVKEPKLGARDWGSVTLHPSPSLLSISSPHIQPWYWNANAVMETDGIDRIDKQPPSNYLPAEGGDNLYKQGIITMQ